MNGQFLRWWPAKAVREQWECRLADFYRNRRDYHRMTAGDTKLSHPQVKLLHALINPGCSYVEVGSGSGEITGAVGGWGARAIGFDVAPIAIELAQQNFGREGVDFLISGADKLPLQDESVDGVYCFEVLEHLWNPIDALGEMSRILRPGGFMLVSCPNRFSLDFHLRKRPFARACDIACSLIWSAQTRMTGLRFVNFKPDIDADPLYPDCDMVSSLVPQALPEVLAELGMEPVFIDTYYMAAMHAATKTDLTFQRRCASKLWRWYGDHILLLARKVG